MLRVVEIRQVIQNNRQTAFAVFYGPGPHYLVREAVPFWVVAKVVNLGLLSSDHPLAYGRFQNALPLLEEDKAMIEAASSWGVFAAGPGETLGDLELYQGVPRFMRVVDDTVSDEYLRNEGRELWEAEEVSRKKRERKAPVRNPPAGGTPERASS